MKFAREAWPFVVPFLLLAVGLGAFGHPRWAAAAVFVGLLVLLFFRDPARSSTADDSAVLAPADGKVLRVETIADPELGPGRYHRVVTFLSVFDVHVQRTPVAGEVVVSRLTHGAKLPAYDASIDERNERHLTVLRRPSGELVGVRQLVGLVARRIVCRLEVGQRVARGDSLGLIKFGSRVDLLVPESYTVEVAPGARVKNGETVLARAPVAGASP